MKLFQFLFLITMFHFLVGFECGFFRCGEGREGGGEGGRDSPTLHPPHGEERPKLSIEFGQEQFDCIVRQVKIKTTKTINPLSALPLPGV